ncbi:serine hydrolase [Singulisphaera acidiphila]|uniref:Penicillin-binding protein, beta-lactamase class C n=1 Tax=Singulisphaera acidiphila (strain ATCC BAA-1392 / DSM 18658 / VKM B-2454 / MOB10) TaxID=886293 RepID=L0DHT1_SINAD|nr:serine hydrolase [Singulisphaera acidiphila]AGA28924.1 penicillin-binding protein, beta-lactamase class C [Singulisphaera acidiphila DSM 18658]
MSDCSGSSSNFGRLLILLAMATLIGPNPSYGHNGAVAVAHPAQGIQIDGDLSDWPNDLKTYPIAQVEAGDKLAGKDDLGAHFRIAYDTREHALYVAVEAEDDSVVFDGPAEALWNTQDGCELYIDAAHAGGESLAIQYGRYGNQTQAFGPSDDLVKTVKVAVARTGRHVVYEWRVDLGSELRADRSIGFDVSVADKDEDGSFSWIAWGKGTQKLSLPDRCGEALLVSPETRFGEVAGQIEWRVPSQSPLPSRVRIQSSRNARLWREAIVDPTGVYKAALLPAGPYQVGPVDSAELRVDETSHVEVQVEADRIANAEPLQVTPIPWPGLIGSEGVLLDPDALNPSEIDRFVQAYVNYYKIPGISIAIIKDEKVAYHRAFGVKNTATQEPVTDDTVFEAASMTKPVLAYVVLRLVDRGILNLDTPLYTYLPYEDIAHDDRYKLITARMVLTHRTGFPNWRTGKLEIKSTPGTEFTYSGEGFVYLGKVVEHLTEKKLDAICQEEVFTPLGIEDAYLAWDERVARAYATGHRDTLPLPKNKVEAPNMAFSLHIDAQNYAKFLIATVQGKGLSEQTSKEMLRPQVQVPDQKRVSWGLGLSIRETAGRTSYGHGGKNPGFTSRSAYDKDRRWGYVFLINNESADEIENVLAAYLISGKSVLKPDQK